MQKLLPKRPVGYGTSILLVNSSLVPPLCCSKFLSFSSYTLSSQARGTMPTSSAYMRYSQPIPQPGKALFAGARCLSFAKSCTCSCESGGEAVPLRARLVSKVARVGGSFCGPRRFSLVANASESGAEVAAADDFNGGGNGTENVKARVLRRHRNSSGDCGAVVRGPDLLAIPGVGPKNLRKLVEKGIEGVDQLKKLYKDKFFGKSNEKMVEFLQSSVGIIHKNHAESIATFIKDRVDEELKDGARQGQKKRITLCVEGNISVGKTTFLKRIANETLELRDLVEIVPEPIDKWQDVGPDHFNILNAFYAEPERYAYTFQNYVFVTRVMQERESSGGIKPLRLMERSVFSDRMVFVRAVHEAKWMNEMEISIYDSWFDPVVSSLPGLIPDGFIYLRATPDTCHKRMMLRKRSEEGGVSLDYLRDLHEKHESWLFPFQSGNHGALSVRKLPDDIDWSLHPNIKDRVFYLDGDHLHSSIRKVPALVLDCEPDVDFSRDVQAKQEYARQVAEFFEFVKSKKEDSDVNGGEEDPPNSNHSHVFLPHHGRLWLPGSKSPESALKQLNFSRAMSLVPPQ